MATLAVKAPRLRSRNSSMLKFCVGQVQSLTIVAGRDFEDSGTIHWHPSMGAFCSFHFPKLEASKAYHAQPMQ